MSSLDLLLQQIDDPSELSWKDETYDLALARDVSGAERTTLVSRLITAARADDPRAVLTLGYINAIEVLPALLGLSKLSSAMSPTARRAVVLLGHGNEVIDEIAHDALHSPAMMIRVAAVLDLPKIGGDTAIDTLLQALGDPAFQIRELAWEGLITALNLDSLVRSPAGKRELMTQIELFSVWIGSAMPSLQRLGVEGMRGLVQDVRGGATPIGVKWIANPAPDTFQKLRLALFDTDAAYPLDEIKQLAGSPRQWAETMILLRLESQDLRVPPALVELRAEWTVPVLEEVAQSDATPSELRAALDETIRSLRAS